MPRQKKILFCTDFRIYITQVYISKHTYYQYTSATVINVPCIALKHNIYKIFYSRTDRNKHTLAKITNLYMRSTQILIFGQQCDLGNENSVTELVERENILTKK